MTNLLNNQQIVDFIINGYMIIKPTFRLGFHESVLSKLDALNITRDNNPGNEILGKVSELQEIWNHPEVKGTFASLLGKDFVMNPHRHCHLNFPGTRSQIWHQDSLNFRHHKIMCALGMYYPQAVTKDMGPTALVPGTHFRNAPSDRMATYGKFKEQVLATVDAGSIVILHYDIWHAASANTGKKPRYMLKFLFDRKSDHTSPAWGYDRNTANQESARFNAAKVLGSAQSDHYKEWGLRREMWNDLLGEDEVNQLEELKKTNIVNA